MFPKATIKQTCIWTDNKMHEMMLVITCQIDLFEWEWQFFSFHYFPMLNWPRIHKQQSLPDAKDPTVLTARQRRSSQDSGSAFKKMAAVGFAERIDHHILQQPTTTIYAKRLSQDPYEKNTSVVCTIKSRLRSFAHLSPVVFLSLVSEV